MTSDAAWSLQSAIFDALSADVQIQSVLGTLPRIYDAIPPDASFPLLQIGAGQVTAYQGIEDAYEHIIRINAFSKWGGRKECKDIATHVRNLLHDARLPLNGQSMVQARLVFEDYLRVRDPEIFQVAMRFRFVTVPEMVSV